MSILTTQNHRKKDSTNIVKQNKYNHNINKFLQPTSPIAKLTTQFFLPKQHDYNQNVLHFYSTTYNFTHKKCSILNKHNEKLNSSLFYKSVNKDISPKNCIIYCHGFGSTRLQAVHILKVLPQNIALCCFDFSGSGKSQGNIITYGAKQKQDIQSVIQYLKQQMNVVNFILWGRSMGATSCLLYSLKIHTNQIQNKDQNQKTNIIFQVIDSAFVSFQKIAIQMAKKFISMPQFGTSLALDMMRQQCSILGDYDPFTVSLQSIQTCKVPTLFIYSQNDDIVSSNNSQYLTKKYTGFFQKIIITQSHNAPRSTQTLGQIMKKIQIQLKKCEITRKNGVMFRSFMSAEEVKGNKSGKKGIDRSLKKENRATIFSRASQRNCDISLGKNEISENYLKIPSKCQTPNPHIYSPQNHSQQNFYRQKVLSYSTMPHDYNFRDYQSPFGDNKNSYNNQEMSKNKINFKNQFQNIWESDNKQQENIHGFIKSENIKNSQTPNKKSQVLSFYQIGKKTNNINNISKKKQQSQQQKYENIYQMRKPQLKTKKTNINVFKNEHYYQSQQKKLEKQADQYYNESIQNNQIKNMKKHRQDYRRSSSGNKKLNISLSMMKVFKDNSNHKIVKQSRNLIQQPSQLQEQRYNILKMDPKKLTFRPSSQYENYVANNHNKKNLMNKNSSIVKSSTFQTTKPTSVSSSMDNKHLLGVLKRPIILSPSNNQSRQQINNQLNNDQLMMTPKRCVKKMRSSEIVYYDRASYRYGI